MVRFLVLECGGASTSAAALALAPASRVDVDAQTNEGDTALHLAVQGGKEEVALFLIRVGKANVNIINTQGLTALTWALNPRLRNVLRCLVLEAGANVGIKARDGYSVVGQAVLTGDLEALSIFLEEAKVVDVESRDHCPRGERLLFLTAWLNGLENPRRRSSSAWPK